jgi:hypothetical protein
MNIGLIDIDSHNYPNLALMKLSAYHKSIGNNIEWVHYSKYYDIVYKSKIFTFTNGNKYFIKADKIIKGGTGYNLDVLPKEIDNMLPDYSIYPQFKEAYGFLTRGCPNKCNFCIVPKKEGNIYAYKDIEEIAGNKKEVVLMDNNVLSCDYGLEQIEKIVRLKLKVDFNQGLDARIIAKNSDIAKLLANVKWLKPLRMACDNKNMKESLWRAVYLLRKFNCTPKRYFIYVLLQNLEDSYDRITFCKNLKLDVHSQPFRDFTSNQILPQWQKDMARYTNHHAIFKTIDFKEYKPRIGFVCKNYFLKNI